jgi:hypothetical protein
MAPIPPRLPWEEETAFEIKNKKSYRYTEPVSEYDVHVAVRKTGKTPEELDKKLAKKFWNGFWLTLGVGFLLFALAGGIAYIHSV